MKNFKDTTTEGRNLFQSLLKRNSSVMLLIEPGTGKILDANEAAINFYGYKDFNSTNIKTINLLPEKEVNAHLNAAVQEEKNRFKFQHKLADGTIKDVEVYATPVMFQGKKLLFSIVHDITEKTEAEQFSRILSEATIGLLELKTPSDVYKYTCDRLYELMKESAIITIVEYDNPNNKWKMMKTRGVNSFFEKTLKKLGIDLQEMEGEINTDYLSHLQKGKIASLDFDLHRLTNGKYSQKTANALKKILPVKELLVMPFRKGETIYGNVSIVITKNTHTFNRQLIEAFISQAATFLEKIVIEKDLRESERKLVEAEKIAHIGNYEINLKTGQERWSKETFNIFGMDSQLEKEPTVEEYAGLVHPQDKNKVLEHYRQCVKEARDFNLVYRIIRKDDTIRYVESLGKIMKNEAGEAIKMFGTFQDITASKKAEKRILQSEKKYRAIFENSHDMISVHPLSENGFEGFPAVNSQTINILGYSREELKKLNIFDIVPEEEHPKVQKAIDRIFDKGNYSIETLHITKSGKIIPVEVNGYIFEVDNKKFLTVVTRSQEKQKQMEDALLKSENYYRSLIENSTDLVSILNEEGTILYKSPSHLTILGYTEEEIIGTNALDKIHEEDVPRIREQLKKLMEQPDGIVKSEFRYRHKNGNWLYLEGTVRNMLHNPAVDGIVINSRNVTDRVRSEQELIKAKEKAEENERLKTAFLANMSHEIRTPMNGILGFIDILNESGLSEDDKKIYLDLVKKSGNRLLNTINDIIEISKIEANQTYLNFSDENLGEILQEHLNFFQPEVSQKGISLKLRKSPEHVLKIRTDKNKLDSILTNLIKNAIKFTEQGAIEFGCKPQGNKLEFFVKDTGVGISADRIEAIFNRFEQAEMGINRGHEGTGLGLSISKAYAEMLGGNLWVESQKGKGSTFCFNINFVPAEKTKEKTEDKPLTKTEKSKTGATILVAEDDEISFTLLEIMLAKENYKLIKANNGNEAVEMVRQNSEIDLVIMDVKMPEKDGLEATQEIRQFNKKIPVIAQTAYALSGDKEKALEAGCNDYISKPLQRNDLLNMINHFLEKKSQKVTGQ